MSNFISTRSLVLLVLLYSTTVAQQPTAVITGPKTQAAGDLVVLDASQSSGLGYLWLLVNSDKTFLPVDNGLKCVFSSASEGRYLFVLIVSGVNANGGPAASMAKHELVLKAHTPEVPPVVVDPTLPPSPNQVTTVVYVYDQRINSVPRPVAAALNDLNKKGILATEFEVDTVDNTGSVPEQYESALKAAKDAGIPCLVVQAGDKVVKVVKNPTTSDHVMNAIGKEGK